MDLRFHYPHRTAKFARCFNRFVWVPPDGRLQSYDKRHRFRMAGEHKRYAPGWERVIVPWRDWRINLQVCYDLRFPELFRTMLDQGMEIIALPSSFTAITGRAHWEPLVRARAIENLCYVLAAGQGGYHVNGRATYGHSMIVDPWGQVMNELANGSGLVCADMDLNRLRNIRRTFPCLDHRHIVCRV